MQIFIYCLVTFIFSTMTKTNGAINKKRRNPQQTIQTQTSRSAKLNLFSLVVPILYCLVIGNTVWFSRKRISPIKCFKTQRIKPLQLLFCFVQLHQFLIVLQLEIQLYVKKYPHKMVQTYSIKLCNCNSDQSSCANSVLS